MFVSSKSMALTGDQSRAEEEVSEASASDVISQGCRGVLGDAGGCWGMRFNLFGEVYVPQPGCAWRMPLVDLPEVISCGKKMKEVSQSISVYLSVSQ